MTADGYPETAVRRPSWRRLTTVELVPQRHRIATDLAALSPVGAWLDLADTTSLLAHGQLTGTHWWRLGTSVAVWVLLRRLRACLTGGYERPGRRGTIPVVRAPDDPYPDALARLFDVVEDRLVRRGSDGPGLVVE
jgi:hypothetical protein